MSLTRSFLNGMGLTADQVSAIIEAHADTVTALKEKSDEYKASADKASKLEAELAEAKKSLAEVGKEDSWKAKYEEEHKAFEDYKAEQAEATSTRTKTEAYRQALKAAGISEKAIDLILDGSKAKEAIKGIELDEQGKIKDADTLTAKMKEEYSGFITSVQAQGAFTATPPASTSSSGKKSRDEILAIKDASERQKAIAENPEAFGIK